MVFFKRFGIFPADMDTGQGGETSPPKTATNEVNDAPAPETSHSEAWRLGRRLILRFAGEEAPFLRRIEFQVRQEEKAGYLERDHNWQGFKWQESAQALSLIFLQYLVWDKAGQPDTFYFSGNSRDSLAASLGDAIYKDGPFHQLFIDPKAHKNDQKLLKKIFWGDNLGGRSETKQLRRISINIPFLPPDCIEVYWDVKGEKVLEGIDDLQRLMNRIRVSLGLPPEPEVQAKKGREESGSPPPDSAESEPKSKPKSPPKPKPEPEPATATELCGEQASKPSAQPGTAIPEVTSPPIDPKLFTVPTSGGYWPDDAPLVAWGDDEDPQVWTLKNSFEGVLILGATGSGKTSGSGATLAESFLRAGFGGLVLTVKKNEAEHWRKLCAYCGRENDFVVVRPGGNWRLNILAYEAQRPGHGSGLSANMVAFCRNLLSISTRSKGSGVNEQFWQSATDQLLNATFDLFLLAGGNLSFDRLADFVAAAPTGNVPTDEEGWLKVPIFGDVLAKAQDCAGDAEDLRILKRTTDYWFKIYPGLANKTRTSITLGVFALLDAFRGRNIPNIISTDTNITPESIMAGKIVVLDLPLKEYGHTGLLVQSAWKYLFQMALERQSGANDPRRRPVFLWEDEGQYFFSEHDHHFQDTARSARVCRVILSQNLHNFYKEFGESGGAAANSVFGNLNTKIFHANSDPTTNEWAAKHFGQEIHQRLTISHNPPPPPRPASNNFAASLMDAFDPPSSAGISTTEHWEYVVKPHEFNVLRTGGPENEFEVDAYITWLGAGVNGGRHFTFITFNQNPNL